MCSDGPWIYKHEGMYGFVVVDLLFIVTPIVRVCNCSMFCCTLLYVSYSFDIFLASRDCCVALPRDAMGLSAVCDCGIS